MKNTGKDGCWLVFLNICLTHRNHYRTNRKVDCLSTVATVNLLTNLQQSHIAQELRTNFQEKE